jgi:hypothetical protein
MNMVDRLFDSLEKLLNMTHYMELLATNQPWNLFDFYGYPSGSS